MGGRLFISESVDVYQNIVFLTIIGASLLWFTNIIYIAVIKKYKYDKEYSYYADMFKMWYVLLIYILLISPLYCSVELIENDGKYTLIVILLVIEIIVISLFYCFRSIIYNKKPKGLINTIVSLKNLKVLTIISLLIMLITLFLNFYLWIIC